ncbi:MAG: aldehyde dehydrogenase family protein, partial [Candidatus Delongbacteria bacterium]|nr:aldehyde dehydrogenase family protein [Candidatus Delongbacteria bacterium]
TNQIVNFWSQSHILPEPYGQVLIISPWNYPFNLTIAPLAAAIAAGNVIAIKPSEFSVRTSSLLEKLLSEYFPRDYIRVFNGDKKVSQFLLEYNWDYIFFTGSPRVGQIIMKQAAENMTPVTLELGGKSPVYVSKTSNVKLAAKRIVWGKLLNAGQTCIAPDHVYADDNITDDLIDAMIKHIHDFWGEEPCDHPDYPKIINKEKAERLKNLLNNCDIIQSGKIDVEKQNISPVIVKNCPESHPLMKEEIFGPVLPVISVGSDDEAIENIKSRAKPLAMYVFSTNKIQIHKIEKSISSGGMCINDTIMHITNSRLPFGGVGNSGMGSYHGKAGFDAFTHYKSIMKKSNLTDPALRYPPYTEFKLKLTKKVLK